MSSGGSSAESNVLPFVRMLIVASDTTSDPQDNSTILMDVWSTRHLHEETQFPFQIDRFVVYAKNSTMR